MERFVLTLGVVGTVVAVLSAGVLAWSLDKWNAIETVELDGVGEAAEGETTNWLLVGSDSREGISEDDVNAGVLVGEGVPEGKRTDTIIIARVNPELAEVHLLSVPRDLFVSYSDGGDGRINAAFNGEGGEQRLLETVEQSLDIEIHHYAEINFVGFRDIVDSIGGVPIWFDRPMRDAGSGLDIGSAGCHQLTGDQALAFARGRNLEYFQDGAWRLDGTGDLGRTSRQQYFLRRVAATAVSRLDIADLGTINGVLDAGGDNFTKDQTIGPDDLLGLAQIFANVGDDQIIGHSLPVYDFRTSSGAAVLGLDREAAAGVLAIFRGEEPPAAAEVIVPQVYHVVNGNRVAGQAGEISTALAEVGINVENISNGPTTETTTIRYAPGHEAGAARLAAYLIAGPAFQVDPTLEVVELVTGTDFQGLRATPRENYELPTTSTTAPAASAEEEPAAASTTAPTAPTSSVPGVVPAATPEGTLCE